MKNFAKVFAVGVVLLALVLVTACGGNDVDADIEVDDNAYENGYDENATEYDNGETDTDVDTGDGQNQNQPGNPFDNTDCGAAWYR